MTREELVDKAKELRDQGKTYREIDNLLGLPAYKAWHLINREASLANSRDSYKRYVDRGRIPLCDMED